MNNDIERVLYSREDIHQVAQKLGKELTTAYAGKNPLIICVLKGAVLFTTDIIREMDIYADLDFINLSSYGNETISSGEVQLTKDLDADVTGRDVLVIEDIIDTGRTLKFLVDLLKRRDVNSVKVCTLLDKPAGRLVDIKADYIGFEVPNEFVVGYGLDYAERYRNLPYVGILKPAIFEFSTWEIRTLETMCYSFFQAT